MAPRSRSPSVCSDNSARTDELMPWELSDALRTAARAGNTERLLELIPHAVQAESIDHTDSNGFTALQWAAWEGHTEAVPILLARGADINSADSDGQTPLYNAAWHGHADVVRVLARSGAAINRPDADGETPLAAAAANGITSVVAALCAAGADPFLTDSMSRTPRRRAHDGGHMTVAVALAAYEDHCTMLLQDGVRLRVRDGLQRWPTLAVSGDWGATTVAGLRSLIASYWSVPADALALGDPSGRYAAQPDDKWSCLAIGAVTGGEVWVWPSSRTKGGMQVPPSGAPAEAQLLGGTTDMLAAQPLRPLNRQQAPPQHHAPMPMSIPVPEPAPALAACLPRPPRSAMPLPPPSPPVAARVATVKSPEPTEKLRRALQIDPESADAARAAEMCLDGADDGYMHDNGDAEAEVLSVLPYQQMLKRISRSWMNGRQGDGPRGSPAQPPPSSTPSRGAPAAATPPCRAAASPPAAASAPAPEQTPAQPFGVTAGPSPPRPPLAPPAPVPAPPPALPADAPLDNSELEVIAEVMGLPTGAQAVDVPSRDLSPDIADGEEASAGSLPSTPPPRAPRPRQALVAAPPAPAPAVVAAPATVVAAPAGPVPVGPTTPLHWAAMRGEVHTMDLLLHHAPLGCIEARDAQGRTPLMWAAIGGQLRSVEWLVARGATADVRDRSGLSAAAHAVQNGKNDVLRYLAESPATKRHFDAESPDFEGHTLLQWSAYRGFLSTAKYLVEACGASVDARDGRGRSALHWSALQGRKEVVMYLLSRGADAGTADSAGATAEGDAASRGHVGVAELLQMCNARSCVTSTATLSAPPSLALPTRQPSRQPSVSTALRRM